jgi:TctA family transporter
MLETAFRQSLIMADGSFFIFVERPISAVTLLVAVLVLISTGFSYYRKTKAEVILE